MKTVIRKMPYEVSQFHETEQWLSDRAAEGLHFKECMLGFASLTRGEKKNVRYRLDFAHDFREPSKEQKALYAEMGWEYVTTIRGDYFLFRTEDENAPELHTEDAPIEQDQKKIFWKQLRPWFIVYLALFTLPTLLSMLDIALEDGLAYAAATYGSRTLLFLTLALVLLVIGIVRDIRLAIQYKRGKRNKKVLLPFSPTWIALIMLLVGAFFLSINTVRYHAPDEMAPTELRYPTLKQVDIAAYERVRHFIDLRNTPEALGAYWESGRNFDCSDHHYARNDFLVRHEVLSQQYSAWPSHEDGWVYPDEECHYYVHAYRCLTEGLAKDLADTLLNESGRKTEDWEAILHGGESKVWFLQEDKHDSSDTYDRLILQLGKEVMEVTYLGGQDILSFLPQYEAAMTE